MKKISFSQENFPFLIEKLQQEHVCIFPSDTSFGFSASPFSLKAIAQIQSIKQRPPEKPFLLLVDCWETAQDYGIFSEQMQEFSRARWQENTPTTILVPKTSKLQHFFPDFQEVGIRVPTLPILKEFLKQWEKPLISTSANISGNAPIFSEKILERYFASHDICFSSFGDLPLKNQSEIWKEENTKLIRVR